MSRKHHDLQTIGLAKSNKELEKRAKNKTNPKQVHDPINMSKRRMDQR